MEKLTTLFWYILHYYFATWGINLYEYLIIHKAGRQRPSSLLWRALEDRDADSFRFSTGSWVAAWILCAGVCWAGTAALVRGRLPSRVEHVLAGVIGGDKVELWLNGERTAKNATGIFQRRCQQSDIRKSRPLRQKSKIIIWYFGFEEGSGKLWGQFEGNWPSEWWILPQSCIPDKLTGKIAQGLQGKPKGGGSSRRKSNWGRAGQGINFDVGTGLGKGGRSIASNNRWGIQQGNRKIGLPQGQALGIVWKFGPLEAGIAGMHGLSSRRGVAAIVRWNSQCYRR
jgi:hypothetical protein